MKKIFVIVTLISLLILITPSCKKSSTSTSTDGNGSTKLISVGKTALNFVETDSNGTSINLESYRGKVILVNISAMWCGPCKNEATHLPALYNKYKDQGLEIIQVIYEDEDGEPTDASDLKRWIKNYNLPFPVVTDPDVSVVMEWVGNRGIPRNIVIDKDFVIRYVQSGFNESVVKSAIEKYL